MANQFHLLGVYVVLNAKVNFLLLSQLYNLFVPSVVIVKFLSHVLPHLVNFVDLFGFQLLYEVERSLLVVRHVLVPSICELLVLESLGVLDIYEFSLLSYAHIMVLSTLLVLAPSIEDLFILVGHHVVPN